MSFPGGSDSQESACEAGDPGSIPGQEDLLEKGMAIHSSILAQRIPWTEEPGGLQFWGSLVGVAESDRTEQQTLSLFTFKIIFIVNTLTFFLNIYPI